MSAAVAIAARKLQAAVDDLEDVGHVRSVEVDDKGDRIEVVIRVRMDRPTTRRRAKGEDA